jgi:Uma2 family endonuclease
MNRQWSVPAAEVWPDHTQLPDKDGKPVKNEQEPPQSTLLTESIWPILGRLYPDGRYWIGQDCGIYWRRPRDTEEPLQAAIVPEWYLVLGVPQMLEGELFRHSYVLGQEHKVPLLAIEYVSGDGSEERDRTPQTGKFWVYEQGIKIPYYAIYEVDPGQVTVYHRVRGHYRQQRPNQRGHYLIQPLGIELGIRQGRYKNLELPWLRWYDARGRLLPCDEERAEQETRQKKQERQEKKQAQRRAEEADRRAEEADRRADRERQEKEQAQRQAERLAQRLRELGLDPEA